MWLHVGPTQFTRIIFLSQYHLPIRNIITSTKSSLPLKITEQAAGNNEDMDTFWRAIIQPITDILGRYCTSNSWYNLDLREEAHSEGRSQWVISILGLLLSWDWTTQRGWCHITLMSKTWACAQKAGILGEISKGNWGAAGEARGQLGGFWEAGKEHFWNSREFKCTDGSSKKRS